MPPIVTKPELSIEESSKPIWRYIDLSKYLLMLLNKCLFFSYVTSFDDPFEGSFLPSRNNKIQVLDQRTGSRIEFMTIGEMINKGIDRIDEIVYREVTVNCWHFSECESMAMWHLYSNAKDGLAIKSTPQNLKISLHNKANEFEIVVSDVKYIDYETDEFENFGLYQAFLCKRKGFEYEKEVRAIAYKKHGWASNNNSKGVEIGVNINKLVNEIFVHPLSKPGFETLICDITKKYGYKFDVKRSSLDKEPSF